MCGIAGFVDFRKRLDRADLVDMTDALSYRGPDDSGYEIYKNDFFHVGLGHRRLSILDLSPFGHQPMRYENLSIVFNGEIYNFKDIRAELIKFNYKFSSNSDTEVILKAFHKWGKECLNKFRGMWAFAIYDSAKEELILCRDRMGVKPLYHYQDGDKFLFSSELKSFHKISSFIKKENPQSVYLYFKYGYIPTPHTIFENTCKLEPGTILTINKNQNIKKDVYWDAFEYSYDGYKRVEFYQKEDNVLKNLHSILIEAFGLRMISDIPVGVFLSGGIDSSLVASVLQAQSKNKINTFTIGFNEKDTNEAVWAKKVAQYIGTSHTELYIEPKDAKEYLEILPDMFDEPFADNSSIPTFIVSKLAKEQVGVALSADGGDELFGGYTNYIPAIKLYNVLQYMPGFLKKSISNFLDFDIIKNRILNIKYLKNSAHSYDKYCKLKESVLAKNALDIFDISKSYWLDGDLRQIFNFSIQKGSIYSINLQYKDTLNLLLLFDQKTYMLDDILTKVDRATMFNSLEGREPFLDNKIVEFALSLPSSWKIRNGQNKYLLKQILYKYLPKELVDRPKQGFGMPIQQWFKNDLKSLYEYYLSKDKLDETGYFNSDYIRLNLKEYFKGKKINSSKFWLILMYMKWRERWM
ncbi:asparagine synthase (glutamine-hydrolyzing) [Campylobacter curvus]|uniref:asparagine synthase (glutamine-hydrolyzing) n=1 Tax=Campylobacter curvus TaxID=200 RepID=UPI00146FFC3D|nr:asparagine synthase (glutamine-hydrolyzing) [Campylobacter curvus]